MLFSDFPELLFKYLKPVRPPYSASGSVWIGEQMQHLVCLNLPQLLLSMGPSHASTTHVHRLKVSQEYVDSFLVSLDFVGSLPISQKFACG